LLYHWYELTHAAIMPARAAVHSCRLLVNSLHPLAHTAFGRSATAACEVFERATRRYRRPEFAISATIVDGRPVPVSETVVWESPFCRLLHFKRAIAAARSAQDPRLLLVAPLSGHFAALLRGTVAALLPRHEVYITDWQDAREIALSAGHFDLDDHIATIMSLLRLFAGDVHVFAVCQPAVPVLAATALLEEEGDGAVPRSLILAGGPVDTRIAPTVVNRLAKERGTDWFRRNVITRVPWPYRGVGRRVYPGFLQLTGFMTMNLDRHILAHRDLFLHLVRGDGDSADKHRRFYDAYLAVMDLTAEFYLQTIDAVFVKHALPRGQMMHRGRRIDLKAIRRVALMTIEGEEDDITSRGQCRAALDLCAGVPPAKKWHFECPRVGHFGVFNGSRFRAEIAARIAQFVRAHDPRLAEETRPALKARSASDRASSEPSLKALGSPCQ
jgi:poly(3-hydroxybutyrate) depolymerase